MGGILLLRHNDYPAVANWLISNYGWRTSYIIAIVALVLIILAAQFLKRDPGQSGLSPYGESEVQENGAGVETREFSLQGGAIHTRQYWLFCITLFCSWIGIGITLAHIVIHATGLGISAVSAASILAIIGGIGILGRITMGGIADRIGNK